MEKLKFPKSIKGYDCLGPCYDKGVSFIHPVTFTRHSNKKNYICPVKEYVVKENNKTTIYHTDLCNFTGNKQNNYTDSLLPTIDVNEKNFLELYYNIFELNDGIQYLTDKNYINILTKKRLIKCLFIVHGGEKYKNMIIIDDVFIQFFVDYLSKYIEDLYCSVYGYLVLEKSKIILSKNKDTYMDIKENKIEKINFIKNKFLNEESMSVYVTKYFKNYKKDANKNKDDDIIEKIINDFPVYIKNKIIASI